MKRAFHAFAFLCLLGIPIGVKAQQNNGVVSITVTNVAANITVDRDCNYVVIRENAATPTAVFDLTIGTSVTAHHYAAGTQYVFTAQKGSGGGPFKSGSTIGTIVATTAGPFTFTADEFYGDPSLAAKNGTGATTPSGVVHYVAAAGSNSNSGLDPSHAWAFSPGMAGCTSFCTAYTVFPGDTILFNKGDTWRDTLTPAVSGIASARINYDAYGSGANPTIAGADVMSAFSNGGSNIWDKTGVTTQPLVVIINGAKGNLKGSRAACTAPGDWFWVTNTLSVFSTVDPSGNVEAGQRTYAVNTNGKNYLAMNNLTFYGANSMGIYIQATSNSTFTGLQSKWNKNSGYLMRSDSNDTLTNDDALGNGFVGFQADSVDSNITLLACTAENNTGDGFFLDGVATATVTGGSATNNGTASNEGNGIDILQESSGTASSNITVTNFTSHDNFGSGLDVISALLGDTGNFNITITGGSYYNNLNGASLASGIRFDDNTKNSIIQYVQSYNNGSAGIVVESQSHDNTVAYNQVWGNNNGITQSQSPGVNNVFYGNVSYSNTQDGFQVATGGSAATVKNNIWYFNGRYGFNTDGSVTDVVDYNISFGNVTNNYNGITKPTHDINSNPLFTNASGHIFTLTTGSPAINAGVTLTSAYQLALDPRTSPPYVTANQNSFGAGWEIGAFVWIE
jgi:hypothetical protein